MHEFSDFALGLLLLWTFFTAGILIWNNPFSFEEVKKAEDQDGPWPPE